MAESNVNGNLAFKCILYKIFFPAHFFPLSYIIIPGGLAPNVWDHRGVQVRSESESEPDPIRAGLINPDRIGSDFIVFYSDRIKLSFSIRILFRIY